MTHEMDNDTLNAQTRCGIVALIGAPNAGKSTLVNALLAQEPDILLSVSFTTRPPRPGEQHGREYFFASEAEFLAAITAARTETFNQFNRDISIASDHPASSGNFGGDFTLQGGWMIDAPQTLRDIDGSTNLFFGMSPGSWADMSFSTPLRAFGAWFNGVPPTFIIDANSLEGYGSYRRVARLEPTGSGLQFIGFTSDQTFNRLVFESAGCCSTSFAIDNLSYATALAPVPEPETWGLMGLPLEFDVGEALEPA